MAGGTTNMKNVASIFINRRAFFRIYLIVLFFASVPIIFLGFTNYRNTTTNLKKEFDQSSMDLLEQTKTAVDIAINNAIYTTNQVYSDDNLLSLLRKNKLMNKDKVDIISRLRQIKYSCQYVDSVALYLTDNKMVFNSDYGSTSIDKYPDRDVILNNIGNMFVVKLINSRDMYKSVVNDASSIRTITLLKTVPFTTSKYAVLMVNFDSNAIYENIIKKFCIEDKTEIFAISKEGNNIFGNKKLNMVPLVIKDKQFIERMRLNQKNSNISLSLDNEKYLVESTYSDILDANFVKISSYEELINVFSSVREISIINSIFLFIVMLSLAMYISQKTTKPIDELIKIISMQKITSNKGSNVFKSIYYFVNETINKNYKLQDKINKMIPIYKERFLYTLLVNSNLKSEDIHKRLEEYNIQFEKKVFQVCSIDILNLYELSAKNLNLTTVKFTIEEIIERVISEKEIAAFKVSIDDERIAMIICFDEESGNENKKRITDFLKKIYVIAAGELGIDLAFGISESGNNVEELGILFNESKKALKCRVLGDPNNIVFISDIMHVKMDTEKDTFQDIKEKMETYFLVGDEYNAQKLFIEEINKQASRKDVTIADFQYNILNYTMLLFNIATRLDINVYGNTVENGDLLKTLGKLKTFADARSFFRILVSKIFAHSNVGKSDSESYYHSKILAYLDEHYNEDISINDLSDHVKISPSYIFKIIRERESDTFKEYIAKKRVERACQLLKSNMYINKIAEMTGFASANYFTQVFKKYKGCTPYEYKKVNAFK